MNIGKLGGREGGEYGREEGVIEAMLICENINEVKARM